MRFGPFLGIAILLVILWLCGFLMFHVASGLIHLLLLRSRARLARLLGNLRLMALRLLHLASIFPAHYLFEMLRR